MKIKLVFITLILITTISYAQQSAQITRGGQEPLWVNDPYSYYPKNKFVAAVGSAENRTEAEKRALASLAAIFGQSIESDFNSSTIYSEAVSRGIITVSDNKNIQDSILTSVSMDNLIGAEIGNVWDNGRGSVHAVAYLERQKAINIYSEMIHVNIININSLINMTNEEKNTFNGYARYKLAALLAKINSNYASVITTVGGSVSSFDMANAVALNIEASNIARNITIGIEIKGDVNNRIRNAFNKVITAEGLRTQGINIQYILEAEIIMEDLSGQNPNNRFVFCNWTVNADLKEKATGQVLFAYNVSGRNSHGSFAEAQNVSIREIERKIGTEFQAVVREYLESLLPQ